MGFSERAVFAFLVVAFFSTATGPAGAETRCLQETSPSYSIQKDFPYNDIAVRPQDCWVYHPPRVIGGIRYEGYYSYDCYACGEYCNISKLIYCKDPLKPSCESKQLVHALGYNGLGYLPGWTIFRYYGTMYPTTGDGVCVSPESKSLAGFLLKQARCEVSRFIGIPGVLDYDCPKSCLQLYGSDPLSGGSYGPYLVVCEQGDGSYTCVNAANDPMNCGSCGNECTGGKRCDAGVCQCPPGTEDCGNRCAQVKADPQHCGSCSGVDSNCLAYRIPEACIAGQGCGVSVCTGPGDAACENLPGVQGFQCCATSTGKYLCTNTKDRAAVANCGSCGNVCSQGANIGKPFCCAPCNTTNYRCQGTPCGAC